MKLAYRNVTNDFVHEHIAIPIEGAYIETEEGVNYPASFYSGGCPPEDRGQHHGLLELRYFGSLPPGFIARDVGIVGQGWGTRPVAVCFRVADITHPTRLVFPSLPGGSIDLAEAVTTNPGFPGDVGILQPVEVSRMAGLVVDEVPDRAVMSLDGTCSVDTTGYYRLFLHYTVVNKDEYDGVHFSGHLGYVGVEPGSGNYSLHPLEYDFEVGPGQTVAMHFEINTLASPRDELSFPPGRPILFVLSGRLSNEARGYSVVSVDSCQSE